MWHAHRSRRWCHIAPVRLCPVCPAIFACPTVPLTRNSSSRGASSRGDRHSRGRSNGGGSGSQRGEEGASRPRLMSGESTHRSGGSTHRSRWDLEEEHRQRLRDQERAEAEVGRKRRLQYLFQHVCARLQSTHSLWREPELMLISVHLCRPKHTLADTTTHARRRHCEHSGSWHSAWLKNAAGARARTISHVQTSSKPSLPPPRRSAVAAAAGTKEEILRHLGRGEGMQQTGGRKPPVRACVLACVRACGRAVCAWCKQSDPRTSQPGDRAKRLFSFTHSLISLRCYWHVLTPTMNRTDASNVMQHGVVVQRRCVVELTCIHFCCSLAC